MKNMPFEDSVNIVSEPLDLSEIEFTFKVVGKVQFWIGINDLQEENV